jgi:hypothetical protein
MACRFHSAVLFLALSAMVAGCSGTSVGTDPARPPATSDAAGPAVVRQPLEDSLTPPPGASAPTAEPSAPIVVPADTLYICVVDAGGVRRQTAIEFAPKVAQLCAKHPEMSPCQYERNACRRSGGRVYAANGKEITMEIEAEYDRKVLRVRFKAG